MATYSDIITIIRRENRDLKRRERDVWDGDATTTLFIASKDNIVAGSYTVKISGTPKVENVDYTLDKDSGELIFATAPTSGNDNVTFEYQYTRATDLQYIQWLNDGIDHFKKKLWVQVLNDSTITSTAYTSEIDLASLSTKIEAIIDIWFKAAVSPPDSTDWTSITTFTNCKYLKSTNKLLVNPAFVNTGWPLKINYLDSFTKGTAIGDTFNPPETFWGVYKAYVKSKYVYTEAYKRLHDTSAVTKEDSYDPSSTLFQQARNLAKEAEDECSRVRLTKPAVKIPIVIDGVHS